MYSNDWKNEHFFGNIVLSIDLLLQPLNYFRSRQLLDSGVEVIKESIRSKGLQQKILDIKVVALDNQLYTKALMKRDEGLNAGRTSANVFPDYRPSDEDIKKVPLYVVSGAHSTQALKELRNA